MKKFFLLIGIVALSLTAMAQKRVAVYVDGKDAILLSEVAGEMVRAISQSRNYTAVNRSDEFSKQLQNERTYQQSGLVDDKQIVQLGKESGVDYVCAVSIKEIASYEYSIEARLIDVQTGDIMAADKRNARYYGRGSSSSEPFRSVYENVRKIGNTITNFEAKSHRSGYLQYSDYSRSRVVLNNFGEEKELSWSEVSSMLISNPEAYELYEEGSALMGTEDRFGYKLLACIGTLVSAGLTIDAFAEDSAVPAGKMAYCAVTAGFAAWWAYEIFHPKICQKRGVKKIKKAISLYNSRNAYSDNLELQFGFTPTGVGLTLNF